MMSQNMEKIYIEYQLFYQSRLAAVRNVKSPKQETGLGNRGRLKVLKDTKLISND